MKIGDTFETFEEFEIELNKFCVENFTHLTKTDPSTSKVEGVKYDYVVYKCVHCPKNEPPTHQVSKVLYDFNVNSRKLNADEQLMVIELLNNDADAKKVCRTMKKKTGKSVITKDVHNCRTTLKLKQIDSTEPKDRQMTELHQKLDFFQH